MKIVNNSLCYTSLSVVQKRIYKFSKEASKVLINLPTQQNKLDKVQEC